MTGKHAHMRLTAHSATVQMNPSTSSNVASTPVAALFSDGILRQETTTTLVKTAASAWKLGPKVGKDDLQRSE